MGKALLAALVVAVTAALAAALVPPSVALARRIGGIDQPGERKVHSTPTPRLGGAAVFLSFTSVVLLGYLAGPRLGDIPFVTARPVPRGGFISGGRTSRSGRRPCRSTFSATEP